jgi:hypothetical protein
VTVKPFRIPFFLPTPLFLTGKFIIILFILAWHFIFSEGIKEGIKEEKLETARRMLHDDFPIESIIKYTGLTEKEIRALIN